MAKFEVGHKKMGGRTKGTPNNSRKWLQNILESNKDLYEEHLQNLPPKEFCAEYRKLMEYVLPKYQSTQMSAFEQLEQDAI